MKDNQITIKELLARQALRDHFAGLAMQNFAEQVGRNADQYYYEQVAEGAYKMADAMLKERAK